MIITLVSFISLELLTVSYVQWIINTPLLFISASFACWAVSKLISFMFSAIYSKGQNSLSNKTSTIKEMSGSIRHKTIQKVIKRKRLNSLQESVQSSKKMLRGKVDQINDKSKIVGGPEAAAGHSARTQYPEGLNGSSEVDLHVHNKTDATADGHNIKESTTKPPEIEGVEEEVKQLVQRILSDVECKEGEQRDDINHLVKTQEAESPSEHVKKIFDAVIKQLTAQPKILKGEKEVDVLAQQMFPVEESKESVHRNDMSKVAGGLEVAAGHSARTQDPEGLNGSSDVECKEGEQRDDINHLVKTQEAESPSEHVKKIFDAVIKQLTAQPKILKGEKEVDVLAQQMLPVVESKESVHRNDMSEVAGGLEAAAGHSARTQDPEGLNGSSEVDLHVHNESDATADGHNIKESTTKLPEKVIAKKEADELGQQVPLSKESKEDSRIQDLSVDVSGSAEGSLLSKFNTTQKKQIVSVFGGGKTKEYGETAFIDDLNTPEYADLRAFIAELELKSKYNKPAIRNELLDKIEGKNQAKVELFEEYIKENILSIMNGHKPKIKANDIHRLSEEKSKSAWAGLYTDTSTMDATPVNFNHFKPSLVNGKLLIDMLRKIESDVDLAKIREACVAAIKGNNPEILNKIIEICEPIEKAVFTYFRVCLEDDIITTPLKFHYLNSSDKQTLLGRYVTNFQKNWSVLVTNLVNEMMENISTQDHHEQQQEAQAMINIKEVEEGIQQTSSDLTDNVPTSSAYLSEIDSLFNGDNPVNGDNPAEYSPVIGYSDSSDSEDESDEALLARLTNGNVAARSNSNAKGTKRSLGADVDNGGKENRILEIR